MKTKKMEMDFGNVSIGKEVIRLGVVIGRSRMSIEEADAMFGNSQVQCALSCDPNSAGDVDGQKKFVDTAVSLDVVANVKGFGVKPDTIKASLSIPKGSVDLVVLGKFASRNGSATLKRLGPAAGKVENDDD